VNAPVHTAEEAYLAAVLAHGANAASELAELVREDDISSPKLQLVHRLVVELTDAGIRPDPAAVLAHAMNERYAEGENQIRALTRTLCRLIDHRAMNNPASARWYAAQALEQAWRRRTVEMATRLAQVAGHADPDELERLTASEQDAVDAVRSRHLALTTPRKLAAVA